MFSGTSGSGLEQLARHAAEYPLLLLPPFLIAIIDAHQASSNDAAILSSRGDRIVARRMLFIHWRETTLGGPSACGSPMARQFGKAFLGPGPGRESAAGGNAAGSRQIPLWGPIVWQYHLTHCPWICPQEGGTRTKGKGAILSASPATLPERVAMGRPILRGVLTTMNSAFQAAASRTMVRDTACQRHAGKHIATVKAKSV